MSGFNEKRASTRRRTYIGADIISGAREGGANCVIRDMSPTGARLRLSTTAPSLFDLRIRRDGAIRLVRKIWQNGEECGVAFKSDETAVKATPAIMVLRRSLRFQAVDEK